jgi:hypothetical protein
MLNLLARRVHQPCCRPVIGIHDVDRTHINAQVSTGMLRKFMGGLDILLSLYQAASSSEQLVCHVATAPLRVVRAMAQHRSQWVW